MAHSEKRKIKTKKKKRNKTHGYIFHAIDMAAAVEMLLRL